MPWQQSCLVQNYITINLLQLGCEQNEIFIELELRWKNRSWNGPLSKMIGCQYQKNVPLESVSEYVSFQCFTAVQWICLRGSCWKPLLEKWSILNILDLPWFSIVFVVLHYGMVLNVRKYIVKYMGWYKIQSALLHKMTPCDVMASLITRLLIQQFVRADSKRNYQALN